MSRLRPVAGASLIAIALPDGGRAFYDRESGDTHLCDAFTADVLDEVAQADDADALVRAVAGRAAYRNVSEPLLRKRVGQALTELRSMGLVEVAGA